MMKNADVIIIIKFNLDSIMYVNLHIHLMIMTNFIVIFLFVHSLMHFTQFIIIILPFSFIFVFSVLNA